VRPGLFLPSPGQGPNSARAKRIGEEQRDSAPHFTRATGPGVQRGRGLRRCSRKRREYAWRPRRSTHRTTLLGGFTKQRRIRKIFGNIHEISEMPNLIEVQRESYEQFLRSDPATGYVSGLEKTLRSVFPIQDFAGTAHLDFDHYELEPPSTTPTSAASAG
jgi:hypothetical protein